MKKTTLLIIFLIIVLNISNILLADSVSADEDALADDEVLYHEYHMNGDNSFSIFQIISSPDNSEIYIDNVLIGYTPAKIFGLSIDSHILVLKKQEYRDYSNTISVSKGETRTILVALNSVQGVQAKKTWPVLNVNCNVECIVYINNQLQENIKNIDLDKGRYNLKVLSKDTNHHNYNTVLDLLDSGDYNFSVYLATFKEQSSHENRLLLSIYSHPLGADVIIDGKEYGKTPLGIATLSLNEHYINLSKKGFLRYNDTIPIISDRGVRYKTIDVTLLSGINADEIINIKEDNELDNKSSADQKAQSIAEKYITVTNFSKEDGTYTFIGERRGRILGIFDISYNITVTVYEDGRTERKRPWYDFFVLDEPEKIE